MDRSLSAQQLAQELGTSIPRVVRAARKLGADTGRQRRYAFTPEMALAIRAKLGVNAAVPGLTAEEARVLKALSSAPFGVRSARSLARRAHVSPTTASNSLRSLGARDLVYFEDRAIAAGRAKPVTLIHANRTTSSWRVIRKQLQDVALPEDAVRPAITVPRDLQHLFWNTSPDQMNVREDGGYIARRLIDRNDYNGLAWGSQHLRPEDWRHAATSRGLDARTRVLAENLAGEA
jgi:DNA-binding MarR family transcriptional regulator